MEISKMEKPSTKVVAPPGGRSSNIFAFDEPVPKTPVNQCQKKRNESSIFDPAPPVVAAVAPTNNNNNNVSTTLKENAPPLESNHTNVLPPQQAGVPEGNKHAPCAPGGGRSSSRVLAPPGGKTSISFG